MPLLAALAMAAALGDFSAQPERRHLQGLPGDVRVHIDRQMGCNHWAGEEPMTPRGAGRSNGPSAS